MTFSSIYVILNVYFINHEEAFTIKKKTHRLFGLLMAGIMTISGLAFPSVTKKSEVSQLAGISISASAAEGRLYNQFDTKWKQKRYYYGSSSSTLYDGGCGLFALANAVYALNGNQMNMDSLATWASKYGYWRPGSGGTYREPFYKNVTAAFGGIYDFKAEGQYWYGVSSSGLKSWLLQGKAAVAHVDGHFIALSGYHEGSQTFRVIESAVSKKRELLPYSWVTQYKLSNGYSKIDWFCLIDETNPAYFPRCAGDFESIIKALESVGAQSSFAYRRQIYIRNGFTDTYLGTAEQNITMLNMLKQGTLKKP